jgi:hypothetical protein
MARKDLLSEAIADAKAVKETALANAKLALEEAFTPKLQSMISAKLAEEMDDEDMEETYNEEELELGDETLAAADEMEEGEHEEMEEEMEDDSMEEEMEDELEEEEMDYEEGMYEEEDEDMLDLESIIRELEGESEMEDEMEDDGDDDDDDDDDEEIDLEEVIRTLREMEDEEMEEGEHGDEMEEGEHGDEMEEEADDMAAELEEAYKTIKSLRATINEVNLLNAKLLYTNKLFRTFDLNESQKVKVLENFDRTSSVREVKLVFSTIAENLNVARRKKTVVKEGYASKTIKSSAPRKQIITETNDMAARWKKLAGLK